MGGVGFRPHILTFTHGGHVLVCHLVSHPPPHVDHLVLEAVFLTTVLLDLRVDVLHQGVPLHQHVSECGAGEDSHHLRIFILRSTFTTKQKNRRSKMIHFTKVY